MKVQCIHCGDEIRQEYINDRDGRRLAWVHQETGTDECFDSDHQRRIASPECPDCGKEVDDASN